VKTMHGVGEAESNQKNHESLLEGYDRGESRVPNGTWKISEKEGGGIHTKAGGGKLRQKGSFKRIQKFKKGWNLKPTGQLGRGKR